MALDTITRLYGRLLEIPDKRGIFEATLFKGKYEAKLEFPEEWGVQTKKTFHARGSMNIFWKNTILKLSTCIFSLEIRSVCNEVFLKPFSSSNKRLKWVDSCRQDLTEPWH